MNLLLDANLSWRLIPILEVHFGNCSHVDKIVELPKPAKDNDIWNYAQVHELIIVTNDEDFVNLVNMRGFPPKVVLLKAFNQSNMVIANLLINRKTEIQELSKSQTTGLLQIIQRPS